MGLAIGSEMSGNVYNVVFRNLYMNGTEVYVSNLLFRFLAFSFLVSRVLVLVLVFSLSRFIFRFGVADILQRTQAKDYARPRRIRNERDLREHTIE